MVERETLKISYDEMERELNAQAAEDEGPKVEKPRGIIEFGTTDGKVDAFSMLVGLDGLTVDKNVSWKKAVVIDGGKKKVGLKGHVCLTAEFPSGIELPLKRTDGSIGYYRVLPNTQYGADRFINFTIDAKPVRVEPAPLQGAEVEA